MSDVLRLSSCYMSSYMQLKCNLLVMIPGQFLHFACRICAQSCIRHSCFSRGCTLALTKANRGNLILTFSHDSYASSPIGYPRFVNSLLFKEMYSCNMPDRYFYWCCLPRIKLEMFLVPGYLGLPESSNFNR